MFAITRLQITTVEDQSKALLLKTLPHVAKFINENDVNSYFYMLEHIEELLLSEIRKTLDGLDADKASIAQAKEIIAATKDVDTDMREERAKFA